MYALTLANLLKFRGAIIAVCPALLVYTLLYLRDALLEQIAAQGLTTPAPDAIRGPKPQGGAADELG